MFRSHARSFDTVLLILRLALAAVMFPHGLQKTVGAFGGPGFSHAMTFFTTMMHVPAPLALIVILTESVGALFVAIGFLTRIAAFAIFVDMLVAVVLVHAQNGYFMNWAGTQKGEGIEYFVYALAVSLVIVIAGPGRFSVDAPIGGEAPDAERARYRTSYR